LFTGFSKGGEKREGVLTPNCINSKPSLNSRKEKKQRELNAPEVNASNKETKTMAGNIANSA